ncbi:MAG: methyltransferase type 11 [uncultured bacterium]|nr:MAG: methyltransferase type 11 [uncultured bacterium]
MTLAKSDVKYFQKGEKENPKFWSRFGKEPSFDGLSVLDVGCGHGSLCVDIASKGAKKVVGIDTNGHFIDFARENAVKNFPKLKNILEFKNCEIGVLPECKFDIILSKDSFEHILNVDVVLWEMKKRLKLFGKIYLGFGPLYSSPFGDHKRLRAILPWGHLIFPESFLLKKLNKKNREKIANVYDLGLNKLSLDEFEKLFYKSGLRVLYFGVNVSNNPLSMIFSLTRKISFLKEYFSHNIYCVLEKVK